MADAIDGPEDEQLAELFAEFLKAADEGRDNSAELLARAGELRARLEAMIALERKVRTLARPTDAPAKSADAPRLFGRFEILGTLGKTGLSRVYLAHDPKLGRRLALKVLDRERILDKQQDSWIDNEARTLAKIEHPGVVRVYEVGKTDTHAYLVMELLTGPSLQEVIAALALQRAGGTQVDGKAPGEAARRCAARLQPYSARIECLARVAEALAYCHDHGILHRDIKPANVLFDGDGNPKLIDFGLAHLASAEEDTKLGLTGRLFGTAGYIAPEQVDNPRPGADPRSDQFVFGTLAYECFALVNPFLRTGHGPTLDAIARAAPPPLASKAPSLPPDLARVVHHALAREPSERYPSLAALAADLRAILANRPVSVEEPSLAHVARLFLRRHRRGVIVAASVLAVVLGLWAGTWATTTVAEASDLRARLAAIEPQKAESASDLEHQLGPVQELVRSAAAIDGRWLRSFLFQPLSPEVHETVHLWSRRLRDLFERDSARCAKDGLVLQDLVYRRLMPQEARLCPTCPYNVAGRMRGHIQFPEGVLDGHDVYLTRLTLLEFPTEGPYLFDQHVMGAFRPTQFLDSLVPGTYRLHARERGSGKLVYESVFHVPEGWPPGMHVALAHPREELWARSLPIKRTRCALNSGLGFLTVPSFRVLNAPISNAEFARFLDETGETLPEFLAGRASDDPAVASFDLAMRYAAWAGGRLPTYSELVLAMQSGGLVLPDRVSWLRGEYVLDRAHPREEVFDAGFLSYVLRQVASCDRELPAETQGPGSPQKYCCFRIAFSTDSTDIYEQLAIQPVEK